METSSIFRFGRALACALALTVAVCGVVALAGCSADQEVQAPPATADQMEYDAVAFAKAWYGDWAFEDGEMQLSRSRVTERCLSYIEYGSDLYTQFQDGADNRAEAYCAVSAEVESADDHVVTVRVEYVSTTDRVTQEEYDAMVERSQHDTVVITFDEAGLIVAVEGLTPGLSGEPLATDGGAN